MPRSVVAEGIFSLRRRSRRESRRSTSRLKSSFHPLGLVPRYKTAATSARNGHKHQPSCNILLLLLLPTAAASSRGANASAASAIAAAAAERLNLTMLPSFEKHPGRQCRNGWGGPPSFFAKKNTTQEECRFCETFGQHRIRLILKYYKCGPRGNPPT